MAFNHTSNLLPSLMTLSQELSDVLSNAIRQRNNASPAAATIMQRVSKIQSRLAGVQSDMERLDVAGEVFDTVYEVLEVPSIYGGLMLEAIRRQEWAERLERQAAASKEHLDNLRSQEHRRRKKWLRSMQGFVTAAHEEPPEVSFSINDPNTWPSVSREDFQAYIDELKSRDSMGETVEDLLSLYKEYTSSTERIGGDEALRLGESASKALPDSDQIRTMKDENTKLADKLRSSESRIRKLEDLLHRQSEKSRPNSAQLDSLMRTNSLSQLGSQSRQSQASSPLKQTSGNQLFDENISAQRAATLEANLLAEKEVTARLQKELSSRDDQEKQASTYKSRIAALEAELQNERATISQLRRDFADERKTNADQIQDAIDIKKDLMGNIQAQQREFENERKELEGEIKSLTAKLEEAEDQLDVRDNERLDFEFQTGLLKEKLKDVQHDLEEELHVLNMRETELDELTKEMDHTRDELKTSEAARIGLVQNLEKWYK
ncbi:oligomeric, coiled-coil, peripheral membrane protein, partial [Ascosphaera atra]